MMNGKSMWSKWILWLFRCLIFLFGLGLILMIMFICWNIVIRYLILWCSEVYRIGSVVCLIFVFFFVFGWVMRWELGLIFRRCLSWLSWEVMLSSFWCVILILFGWRFWVKSWSLLSIIWICWLNNCIWLMMCSCGKIIFFIFMKIVFMLSCFRCVKWSGWEEIRLCRMFWVLYRFILIGVWWICIFVVINCFLRWLFVFIRYSFLCLVVSWCLLFSMVRLLLNLVFIVIFGFLFMFIFVWLRYIVCRKDGIWWFSSIRFVWIFCRGKVVFVRFSGF